MSEFGMAQELRFAGTSWRMVGQSWLSSVACEGSTTMHWLADMYANNSAQINGLI